MLHFLNFRIFDRILSVLVIVILLNFSFVGCSNSGKNNILNNSVMNENKDNTVGKAGGHEVTEQEMIEITEKRYKQQLKLFRQKDWDKEQKDPQKNSNIKKALEIIRNLKNSELPSATIFKPKTKVVLNNISKYYGEKIMFEGKIIDIEKYTTKNEFAENSFNGANYFSILFQMDDGEKVVLYIIGDEKHLPMSAEGLFKEGNKILFAGWPVGITNNNELVLINKNLM